mgnify:CR=1 FL=1
MSDQPKLDNCILFYLLCLKLLGPRSGVQKYYGICFPKLNEIMLKIISSAFHKPNIQTKFNFQAEEAEKERQAQELEKQREREALALAILNGTADKMELERREKEENE